jgi:hypothetical protein
MKKAMVLVMGAASIVAIGTLAAQAIPLNSYAIVADMKCGINVITSTGTVRIDCGKHPVLWELIEDEKFRDRVDLYLSDSIKFSKEVKKTPCEIQGGRDHELAWNDAEQWDFEASSIATAPLCNKPKLLDTIEAAHKPSKT